VNLDLLFDPLFRIPFLVGLLLAATLPPLGVVLRLRNEWLAALGLAHLAGASGLLGLAVGMPAVLGAPLGAVAGALVKSLGHFSGNTVYAVMILVGWATTLLIASNTSLGSVMGHALVEGQLYFAGGIHLAAAVVVAVLMAVALPWLMPRLVRAQLFPGYEVSNRLPAWQWHVSFDVLAALAMAAGAGSLGLMGAFALVFVPPWVSFRLASNWRAGLWISLGIGLVAYLGAFVCALILDQPFGPVLVAFLVVVAAVAQLFRRR
jgi:zinc transport system permease protein